MLDEIGRGVLNIIKGVIIISKKYFFMADLLGFGNIVKNSNVDELNIRIGRWIDLVKKAKSYANIDQIQLISDTLFASVGESEEDFVKLVLFSQYLLNNGIKLSLPIRGAICFDEYVWGDLTYGKAVLNAHELESSQNWIGVICNSDIPHKEELYKEGFLICYPAPLKNSIVKLYAVINWDVPCTNDLIKYLSSEGLLKKGDVYTWNLAEKLNNTIQFALYKHFIIQNNTNPAFFIGNMPIETTEFIVTGRKYDIEKDRLNE